MAKETEISVPVGEVVDYLRIQGEFLPAVVEVTRRKLASEAARQAGLDVTDQELQAVADDFRSKYGLQKKSDMEEWMAANHIDIDSFENYLESSLLIGKLQGHLQEKGTAGGFEGWMQKEMSKLNQHAGAPSDGVTVSTPGFEI